MFYYGTLDLGQLVQMTEELTKKRISDPAGFCAVLFNASEFYDEIRIDECGFSNYRVFDPHRVIQEHNQRPNLDFYPFSYERIYKAGVTDYVDKNFAFKRFSNFLADNYNIGINEADEVVEECVYAIRIGESVGSIMEFLQEQFEIDDEELINEFIDQVIFLSNNTRQWFLKGYSPEELSQKNKIIPFQGKSNKVNAHVGRNDPCPCGSGLKYKKCCGK